MKKSVDLAYHVCIMVYMNAKERMNEWKKLPTNTIPWETFKRLVSQLGTEKAIAKAKEICDTFPEGPITEGDKKLIKMIIRG